MFLSYKDWNCYHDQSMHLRSLADTKQFLSQPNTGTSETAAMYGRCLIKWLVPNIKEVVILRPVEECIESCMKLDLQGVGVFDRAKLTKLFNRSRKCLDKIARDPSVLVINYDDLEKEEICKHLFEFCLPYQFDREWWMYYHEKNIQMIMATGILFRKLNKPAIDSYKSLIKRELFNLVRCGKIPIGSAA